MNFMNLNRENQHLDTRTNSNHQQWHTALECIRFSQRRHEKPFQLFQLVSKSIQNIDHSCKNVNFFPDLLLNRKGRRFYKQIRE